MRITFPRKFARTSLQQKFCCGIAMVDKPVHLSRHIQVARADHVVVAAIIRLSTQAIDKVIQSNDLMLNTNKHTCKLNCLFD